MRKSKVVQRKIRLRSESRALKGSKRPPSKSHNLITQIESRETAKISKKYILIIKAWPIMGNFSHLGQCQPISTDSITTITWALSCHITWELFIHPSHIPPTTLTALLVSFRGCRCSCIINTQWLILIKMRGFMEIIMMHYKNNNVRSQLRRRMDLL